MENIKKDAVNDMPQPLNGCNGKSCDECGTKMPVLNIGANSFLVILKGVVGVIGNSMALLADAMHSGSEVIVAIVNSWKSKNNSAQNDEQKDSERIILEYVVGLGVGVTLGIVSLFILYNSFGRTFYGAHYGPPRILALWIALLAIYMNLMLSSYTTCPAQELENPSLKTISRNNKYDAYLSIPVVICILASQFGYPKLDPIGAMFIGAVIFRLGANLILANYKGAAAWANNASPERRKIFAAQLSVFSNSVLVAGKLIVGTITGSISIIAEGIHSSLDLVAALIANYSVKRSSLPADKEHNFGHGKYENVSALIEGMLIFFAAYLILSAVYRKLQWTGVHLKVVDLGIAIMLVATVANILISRYLFKVAKETGSAALEADALHLRTDVYTSAGVLGGLFLIRIINKPGFEIIDPIFAIFTALIIIHAAYVLCKDAIYNLIDTRLPEAEEGKIYEAIRHHSNRAAGAHTLRTRKAGNQRHIDMRLVIPSGLNVDDANTMVEQIGHGIEQCLENVSLIIQVEACADDCKKCEVKCTNAKEASKEPAVPLVQQPERELP